MVRCIDCEGMTFNFEGVDNHLYKCKTISNMDEDPFKERKCRRFVPRKWD